VIAEELAALLGSVAMSKPKPCIRFILAARFTPRSTSSSLRFEVRIVKSSALCSGTMLVAFTLCLLSFISFSLQMKDPLKDFCRIFGHQTALVDRKLYIDGGLVNWAPLSANSLNYSSQYKPMHIIFAY
jgi:hypothetical protein